MPPIQFLADRREAGQTIATVLRKRFNLPWSRVKSVIAGGHVRVAGFACTDPAHRVKAKNRVWVREGVIELPKAEGGRRTAEPTPAPPPKPAAAKPKPVSAPPPAVPLPPSVLVYADEAVVVVNKPAGLTTMRHADEAAEFGPRGRAYLPKTLADFLPRLLGRPGAKVFPVHRIDRDTSGLVAFALTPAAADHLSKQFRKHAADRRYLALVRGAPADGRIESVLVRDRGDGRRGSAPGPAADGKRAVTYVAVRERFGAYALVECRLETGRTHQVRIHLGEAGAPLCGERVYDRPVNGQPWPDGSGAARPMLHAARLGFAHPATGEPLAWEADPPPDFAKLLRKLRAK
jgi:23S rRNA pseudouridine1911/1915/1917 synthase